MREPALADPSGADPTPAGPEDRRCDDEALVARARHGDLEAFDEIMCRYEGRLLRFLTGLAGDVETARELCQDTFLSAYQALPRSDREIHLGAWLHTIALNRARSYHRSRRLRRFVPLEEHHHPRTADLQEGVARQDLVLRILARLPKQYSEPLLLQIVSGLSCREIAGVVGCSEGAVKVRLLRAREAFRKAYDAEEHGP